MTSTTHDGSFTQPQASDVEAPDQGRLLPDEGTGEAPQRGPGRLRAISIILLAVVIAAVAWYLSDLVSGRSGPPTSQLPVLTAASDPVKMRPDDPGGADIPNRDKYVYKSLELGANTEAHQIEQILPAPEEPMEKPLDPGPVLGPLASVSLGEAWLTPLAADAAAEAPTPAPVEKEAPAVAAEPEVAQIAPASGGVWVQLASLRDNKGAAAEWSRLAKKYPAAFKGVSSRVDRSDLGAKGVWYRLRVGPYADKAAAEAACKVVRAGGQACKLSTP